MILIIIDVIWRLSFLASSGDDVPIVKNNLVQTGNLKVYNLLEGPCRVNN